MTKTRQLVARFAIAKLGLIAKREKCFLATLVATGMGDGQYFFTGEKCSLELARRSRESTIMADIAT